MPNKEKIKTLYAQQDILEEIINHAGAKYDAIDKEIHELELQQTEGETHGGN